MDMKKQKIEKIDKNHPLAKKYLNTFKKDFTKFDITTDRELFGAQLNLFINNIDPKYCSDTMKRWMKEFNLNGASMADFIYTNSHFRSVEAWCSTSHPIRSKKSAIFSTVEPFVG